MGTTVLAYKCIEIDEQVAVGETLEDEHGSGTFCCAGSEVLLGTGWRKWEYRATSALSKSRKIAS